MAALPCPRSSKTALSPHAAPILVGFGTYGICQFISAQLPLPCLFSSTAFPFAFFFLFYLPPLRLADYGLRGVSIAALWPKPSVPSCSKATHVLPAWKRPRPPVSPEGGTATEKREREEKTTAMHDEKAAPRQGGIGSVQRKTDAGWQPKDYRSGGKTKRGRQWGAVVESVPWGLLSCYGSPC